MALVPYSAPSFMGPFHEETRCFNLSGKNWRIVQDWDHIGVAGVVWTAAVVLSMYLEEHKDMIKNKHVIELGAGTGIVGMVAASLGALNVTITDKQIKMIHKNIDVNKNILTNVNVTVEKHEWGGCLAPLIFPPYDVILGADIIYIEDTYNDLIKSLKVLSNINSIVLLSVQERQNKVKTFLKLLDENHLSHSIIYSHGSVVIYQIIKTTNY